MYLRTWKYRQFDSMATLIALGAHPVTAGLTDLPFCHICT
jgi:hypothetical protein